MAIYKSTLLSDIRGSINGATFSRTRAGNVIRNRTQPVQPNSPAQIAQRSRLSVATDVFKAMSGTEVQEWADAISGSGFTETNALGDSYVPSAKQLVTQTSLNLQSIGQAPIPDVGKFLANPNLPDVMAELGTITVTSGSPATLTALAVDIATTNGTSGNCAALIAVTPPLLPSINNYKKYLRTIAQSVTLGDVPTPVAVSILTEYNGKFPSVDWDNAEGLRIGVGVKIVSLDNGLGSAWFEIGMFDIPAPV